MNATHTAKPRTVFTADDLAEIRFHLTHPLTASDARANRERRILSAIDDYIRERVDGGMSTAEAVLCLLEEVDRG